MSGEDEMQKGDWTNHHHEAPKSPINNHQDGSQALTDTFAAENKSNREQKNKKGKSKNN